MKGFLGINIYFFQILLDDIFLIWLFMIYCVIHIFNRLMKVLFFEGPICVIFKWGMGNCVEKHNRLDPTVRTR